MQRTILLLVLLHVAPCVRADWPGFRGPASLGVGQARGLPIQFGPERNVAWKQPLPGPGSSSPIIVGDRVLVTCYSGYGVDKGQGDINKLVRHLLCFERKTGKLLWQRDVPASQPELPYKTQVTQHGYATSTPVSDGARVYVFYGRSGVLAYDLDGKQLWHKEVGKGVNGYGTGSSPTLLGDLLLVNATVESGALVALDKRTGQEVWKAKGLGDCWSTPVVVELPDGKKEVVLNTPASITGFDSASGKELWTCEMISGYASATPLVSAGTIFTMGAGVEGKQVMAVRPGGRGDVTRTHVLWKQTKAGASYCSPLLVGDRLYYFSGEACCLNIKDGAVIFQEKLEGLGREYPSPVFADGRIYLPTRSAGIYVVGAKYRLEVLAHNDLGDASPFNASPAIADGQLFLRSYRFLYCLEGK